MPIENEVGEHQKTHSSKSGLIIYRHPIISCSSFENSGIVVPTLSQKKGKDGPRPNEAVTKRCRASGTLMNSPTPPQHPAYGCVLG